MNMKKVLFFTLLIFLAPAVTRASQPGVETFVYAVKGADTLRLDKYDVPDGSMKPCVIFMFGGGFVSGTRDGKGYLDFFEFLAGEGYTVVSIDYRLGFKNPDMDGRGKARDFLGLFENTIMMAVEDLYSATNFVLSNAAEWSVDPETIVLCGSSAGAVSVLQGEYERANRTEIARALPAGFRYAGVISFAGAIYSNRGHLKWSETPAPVLLFHGDADKNVPYGKVKLFKYGFFGSEYIAKRYDRNGFPYWLYAEENADHRLAGSPMTSEREEIMSFLHKYVAGKQQLVTNTTVVPLDKPKVKKNFGIKTYIRSNFGGE